MASKHRDFTGAVDEKAADEIFGRPETPPNPPASPNLIARPISIHEITPDPKQPRRLLPASLRYDRPVAEVLGDWADMAAAESGHIIPVVRIFRGEETERIQESDTREPGHIEASFMKLVNLAATIRRDGGLINPITVCRNPSPSPSPNSGRGVYQLETGERRWLAHHLLQEALGEPQWHRISAREVAAPSIWRQAHENSARDDLNAISLARQLALLVMDIYMENGVDFYPYETFQHDRHFYAQVADGFQFPVAYGDRERIIAAMGKSNVSQVNQFRALLRLPDDVWQSADDSNTPEGDLRKYLKAEREAQSITQVRDHSSVQAQESATETNEPEAASPPDGSSSVPPVTLPQKLFDWAYRFSAAALTEDTTWFSSNNAGTPPEVLNRFIERGYLEGRKPIINEHRHVAFYRITPMAWDAMGYEPLSFVFNTVPNNLPPGANRPGFTGNLTPPRSGGEVHAGTAGNSGSPPRRVTKQLFDQADRVAITAAMNLTDRRLDTADGLQDAIKLLQRSIAAQQRILDELLLRKRA